MNAFTCLAGVSETLEFELLTCCCAHGTPWPVVVNRVARAPEILEVLVNAGRLEVRNERVILTAEGEERLDVLFAGLHAPREGPLIDRVMGALQAAGPLDVQQLASALRANPPTINRYVQLLTEAGVLERRAREGGRRGRRGRRCYVYRVV